MQKNAGGMRRSDPLENRKVEVGTPVDGDGKLWVRLVFHEPDGNERAYAYDAEGLDV